MYIKFNHRCIWHCMATLLCTIILAFATSCTLSSNQSLPADYQHLTIHIIDVGNADAILIKNGDRSMLIDAGENGDGDDVVAFLRRQGVQTLDYAIATHPDADHIGGMDVVINEIPVSKFIMSIMPAGITPTTKTYIDLLKALDQNNLKITKAAPGESYMLGGSRFTILGPVAEFDSTNDMSVICRLEFGKQRFLFMGDAEKCAENSLLESNTDLKADFIKLGHHGSDTSSQMAFLKAVNPRYAVICCGAGNRYGHPHVKTLALLKELNINYYRSDVNGNITVISDGSKITVKTEK
jgi:competence protein ComEC